MPHRLVDVLQDSGVELASGELLDVLWLARHMPAGDTAPLVRVLGADALHPQEAQRDPVAEPRPDSHPPQQTGASSDEAHMPSRGLGLAPVPRRRTARRPAALHAGAERAADRPVPEEQDKGAGQPPTRPAVPVRAPQDKALSTDELRLGRALRPLKQRHSTGRDWELDEEATAAVMADTGLADVVLRPTRERWLDLVLVVDDGLSMLLWRRLAAELRSLMERLAAFRNLRTYGLDSRSAHAPMLRTRPYDPDAPVLSTAAVSDPSGYTLVLVVSDGVGAAWRDGRMRAVLDRWARYGPTAIVHALPARMWRASGIRAEPWRVTTRRRGAANETWQVADPVLPPDLAAYDGVPVPVLESRPASIGRWATLVASPGASVVLPLAAWHVMPPGRPSDRPGDPVLRFRDAASPQAYRLAAHLAAVAPVSVPVMRLVQAAVPWQAETAHLAEVFLGGLMRPSDPDDDFLPPEHRRFDFAEAERQILLDVAPPGELARTAKAVTQKIAILAGRSPDFPAWLAHPRGKDGLARGRRPFAWLGERLMAHLGVTPDRAGSSPDSAGGAAHSAVPDLQAPPSLWRGLRGDDPRYLGPYKIIERSDVRGIATVYLGLDGDGNEAVLEVAGPRGRSNARGFLDNAAAALTRMAGRYTPTLIATGGYDWLPWLAMESVTTDVHTLAPTLRALGQAHGPLAPSDFFLRLGWHLSRALDIAGRNGLAHGALTPDTVLVTEHTVRITHWMTAQIDGVCPAGTASTPFASDAAFRAPEFHHGALGPQTEAYALGATLIAAATGQLGYRLSKESLFPSLAVSNLPQDLRAVLAACIDSDPAARPAVGEVTEAFEACLPEPPQEDPSTPPEPAGADVLVGRMIGLHHNSRGHAPKSEYRRLVRAIRTPVTGSKRISVIGPSHRLGATTIAALLGVVLAEQRADRVLAVDLNTSGSGVRAPLTRHFYENVHNRATASTGSAGLSYYLATDASGLTIVSDRMADDAGSRRLSPGVKYAQLMSALSPHFSVVIIDHADQTQTLFDNGFADTDSAVIVTAADKVGIVQTRMLLDRLERADPRLAREAVIVVNTAQYAAKKPDSHDVWQLAGRCRGMVIMPYDYHLSSSSVLVLDWLADDTYEMALRLAALVAEGFAPRAPDPEPPRAGTA